MPMRLEEQRVRSESSLSCRRPARRSLSARANGTCIPTRPALNTRRRPAPCRRSGTSAIDHDGAHVRRRDHVQLHPGSPRFLRPVEREAATRVPTPRPRASARDHEAGGGDMRAGPAFGPSWRCRGCAVFDRDDGLARPYSIQMARASALGHRRDRRRGSASRTTLAHDQPSLWPVRFVDARSSLL